MPGEQSVRSDEASDIRQILERPSPDSTSIHSEFPSDPESHKANRTKTHRSSSHRRHRAHRDHDRVTDGGVLDAHQLSRLLAHDEVESVEMRRMLVRTSERLEQETRRANDAEIRARDAEARALALQIAKTNTQAELAREKETLRAYQAQIEVARNEILRAQKELDEMAAEREKVEEAAARDRSNARAMARQIEMQQVFEQGREEGKVQGFVEGRKEGWYIGTRDARKETIKEVERRFYEADTDGVSLSRSTITPPLAPLNNNAAPSVTSIATRSAARPTDTPSPDNQTQTLPRPLSTRTTTPRAGHNRSGSLTQPNKTSSRRSSDPKPPPVPKDKPPIVAPSPVSLERLADQSPSATWRDPGRLSPARYSPSPTPRQTSPIPSGFIPLKENGRVTLPAPHGIEPPPSPHSPAAPLPPEILPNGLLGPSLQPPNMTPNVAPKILVQEPTPPEPSLTMPEPQPAPAPPSENNVKPSRVRARDYAFGARSESPPLPPLPTDRGPKGKQRQRPARPRGASGLHAPGRSSPSDTSTEFSQFEIVTGATEPQERARLAMGRGNGSKLSVIMEGGSTAAESPEPTQAPPTIGVKQYPSPRMGSNTSLNMQDEMPRPPSKQGILHDPREYEDFAETPLSPSQLARRQVIADQLRWTSSEDDPEVTHSVRNVRDDQISIRSPSAPRRRNLKMPERLGPSRAVEVLEKHAEMYDAFGTGQFPSFESPSTPEDPVATRTPDFSPGHRKARSSVTSVPGITIQPPSRPASHSSKVTTVSGNLSPQQNPLPMPAPGTPSRRHSIQGSPMTPSRVPLPQSTFQLPMALTPNNGEITLPPGFQPIQGPPQVMEEIASKTPQVKKMGTMSTKTPNITSGGLGGPSFPYTPAGIPLPMSTATTTRTLPDNTFLPPKETGPSQFDPPVAAASYEAAPIPPGFQYPSSFAPARVPLPESVVGSPLGSVANRMSWGKWGSQGAGNTPGPSMPATLSADRPMALYAGDGGANKKVSSSSLASQYKSFDPKTYLDPAFASVDFVNRQDVKDLKHSNTKTRTRSGSVRSTNDEGGPKSPHGTSVETVTDEDDVSLNRGT